MTKEEFIIYISKDNPGFYKKRKSHIKNVTPNILIEVEQYIQEYDIHPINFNDALNYYLNNITSQVKCIICHKDISSTYMYCSNACKQLDINTVLTKSRQTLKELYGEDSPLKIKKFKDKFKQTCIDTYGIDHFNKTEEYKQIQKESNIETYKDLELRKRIGESYKKTYEENKEDIIEKKKQTNLKNHGEYTTLTTYAIDKIKHTLNERYGVDSPFKIHEETYDKAKLGSLKFYADEDNKNKAIQKRIDTIISRYGSIEELNKIVFEKTKKKTIQFIRDLGFKDEIVEYSYDKLGFIKCKSEKCNHEYEISLQLLRQRVRSNSICCPICLPPYTKNISHGHRELFNWLHSYLNCRFNDRKIMHPLEVDIYAPERNLAIEFNGIYWHSDLFKDKNYHLNKTLFLKNKDISLIHVWEDLWNHKKEIIKGRILSKLNLEQKSIGARKCILKEITSKEANEFYDKNHLQGATKAIKNIALIYKDEIVSCLSIGKRKLGKNKNNDIDFEVLRFCNKLGIICIGSFSKLFNYCTTNYPGKYISYADLSWSEGNVYEKAGFKLIEYSKPNYWYFIDGIRYHRYSFNKQRLIKLGYDKNKTEFQIMDELNALRCYDCGNAVWIYENKKQIQ